ncbi:MAG TPA: Hpt domain-containing protein [Clostridia bacterium]|nr:Hpt domain-containing protein [Clostridia bacterium]
MSNTDSMLDLFLYETNELIDGLEEILLKTENTGFSEEDINEVFRSMHTIKGSSGMMGLDSISNLTHAAEDFFAFIRDNPNVEIDGGEVTDLILRVVDFIKHELNAMRNEDYEQGDARYLVEEIKEYTESVKEGKKQKTFKVHIYFDEGAQMENIRAFGVLNTIENMADIVSTEPMDLDDEKSTEEIQANGFIFIIKSDADENKIKSILQDTMFLKSLQVTEVEKTSRKRKVNIDTTIISDSARNFVSVEVGKLDTLLDIVGELVIAESMLGRTDLGDEYEKAYNNLQRMTDELQNIVMSIRMVPVSGIFHKMQRVVRDLARKIGKDIDLVIKGEQTEVDKKIIDNLSDL